jgi:hypothetical protein
VESDVSAVVVVVGKTDVIGWASAFHRIARSLPLDRQRRSANQPSPSMTSTTSVASDGSSRTGSSAGSSGGRSPGSALAEPPAQ